MTATYWADTDLSTDASMAAIEYEATGLAKRRDGGGNLKTTGTSTSVTLPTGEAAKLRVGSIIVANSLTRLVATLPTTGDVITVDVAVDWSGTGGAGYAYKYQTWGDKIDLAKKIIGREIENTLSSRGYLVDEAAGEVFLNMVSNPERFDLASDYYSLYLTYTDLSIALRNDMYRDKANLFLGAYKTEMQSALRAINLDPGLSGVASIYRAGVISQTTVTRGGIS